MAEIAAYAELGVDAAAHYDWLKRHTSGVAPVCALEATLAAVCKSAITFSQDANGDGVLDASEGATGPAAREAGQNTWALGLAPVTAVHVW
jgi:hypothetical protein